MILIYTTGQPHDRAAGILIPVGSSKSRKRRHDVAAVCIRHFSRKILSIRCRIHQMKFITKPLDSSTSHKYGSLQNIGDLSVKSPSDGCNQPVLGKHRFISCIHQKEATSSVCILSLAFFKAGLSEQCCLLVSGCTGYRDSSTQERRIRFPVDLTGFFHLRKHTFRDIKFFKDLIIPFQSIDIEHHGSGRIGIICYMNSSLGQLPDQPGLHGTKQKLSLLCSFAGTLHIIQDPFYLGGRKIRINNKSCFLTEFFFQSPRFQAVTVLRSSSALPYDCVIHRLPRILIPHNGSFSLICNTNRCDIFRRRLDLIHCLSGNRKLCGPDLTCIMLHPSRFWKMLDKLLLRHTADPSVFIKKNTAITGRSGIQRHNIFCHIKILQYISWLRLNASAAS